MEKYSIIFAYVFIFIFFFVIMLLALYLIFKPIIKQKNLLNGTVNYDAFMHKYVFRIPLKKEDFYAHLKTPNVCDALEYYLSEDYTVITFKMYNYNFSYEMNVAEFNDSIVLRVKQLSVNNRPALHINEFFIKKFDAEPLNFEQYKF